MTTEQSQRGRLPWWSAGIASALLACTGSRTDAQNAQAAQERGLAAIQDARRGGLTEQSLAMTVISGVLREAPSLRRPGAPLVDSLLALAASHSDERTRSMALGVLLRADTSGVGPPIVTPGVLHRLYQQQVTLPMKVLVMEKLTHHHDRAGAVSVLSAIVSTEPGEAAGVEAVNMLAETGPHGQSAIDSLSVTNVANLAVRNRLLRLAKK